MPTSPKDIFSSPIAKTNELDLSSEHQSEKNINNSLLELRYWNWGGFVLTFIWGMANVSFFKYVGWGFIYFISFIYINIITLGDGLLLFVVLYFGSGVYFGLKGNELAWKTGRYENIAKLKTAQKLWSILGIMIIITLVALLLMSFYVSEYIFSWLFDSY